MTCRGWVRSPESSACDRRRHDAGTKRHTYEYILVHSRKVIRTPLACAPAQSPSTVSRIFDEEQGSKLGTETASCWDKAGQGQNSWKRRRASTNPALGDVDLTWTMSRQSIILSGHLTRRATFDSHYCITKRVPTQSWGINRATKRLQLADIHLCPSVHITQLPKHSKKWSVHVLFDLAIGHFSTLNTTAQSDTKVLNLLLTSSGRTTTTCCCALRHSAGLVFHLHPTSAA